MKIHLIAIGGSAMHNLALALHEKGHAVSGSDDEINEPSKSRLQAKGLLPEQIGWFPEKITADLDAIILGMHARSDNPELLRAQALNLKVYSYPEFLYHESKNKQRIVVAGSHGKTTITSMILHVLKSEGKDFDYMVGAQLKGFDTMVKTSASAPVMILEGDEYLASPIDRRPKFMLYQPHVALISGIAWDHVNVFPTYPEYVNQFRMLLEVVQAGGKVIYCANDQDLCALVEENKFRDIEFVPYDLPEFRIENGHTHIITESGATYPLRIFGKHNLMNMEGARLVCNGLGIDDDAFYSGMMHFDGAARRLEKLADNGSSAMFRDFAHSPSKLKATIEAVKEQFGDRDLLACMELHTFSSLTPAFLKEYKGTMDQADEALVYFNPHTVAHKKLPPLYEKDVQEAFASERIKVFTDPQKLAAYLMNRNYSSTNLLLMSSGTFEGLNLQDLAKQF